MEVISLASTYVRIIRSGRRYQGAHEFILLMPSHVPRILRFDRHCHKFPISDNDLLLLLLLRRLSSTIQ